MVAVGTRISGTADDYTTEYECDHDNRLTKLTYKNSGGTITKEIEYGYDLFGRRISKTIDWDGAGSGSAEEVHYIYDGDDILLAFDESGDLTNRYLHGPAVDQILADEQVTSLTSAGDVLWPLADNLGSVRDIVDSTGAVENHLTYDAFGNVTSETDDTVDHIYAYTGRDRDEESDLQYNRCGTTTPTSAVGLAKIRLRSWRGIRISPGMWGTSAPARATHRGLFKPTQCPKWNWWKAPAPFTIPTSLPMP